VSHDPYAAERRDTPGARAARRFTYADDRTLRDVAKDAFKVVARGEESESPRAAGSRSARDQDEALLRATVTASLRDAHEPLVSDADADAFDRMEAAAWDEATYAREPVSADEDAPEPLDTVDQYAAAVIADPAEEEEDWIDPALLDDEEPGTGPIVQLMADDADEGALDPGPHDVFMPGTLAAEAAIRSGQIDPPE
jgi:hypothetical protein